MLEEDPGRYQTLPRRVFLMLAGAGMAPWRRSLASNSEFWNKKPVSQWTPEEIQRVLNDSPWAKRVTARYRAGDEPKLRSSRGGHPPWGGPPPMPLPRRLPWPGAGSEGAGKTTASGYTGIVRWESAKPILDAVEATLPGALADDYVISVNGIPVLPPPGWPAADGDTSRMSADQLDRLKPLATLVADGRAICPVAIEQKATTLTELLFGFSKDTLKVTKRSGEVCFSAWLGRLLVEARFDPRGMRYVGELAL